jgi:ABC-type enterochelin transport system permease subunit
MQDIAMPFLRSCKHGTNIFVTKEGTFIYLCKNQVILARVITFKIGEYFIIIPYNGGNRCI